MQKSSTNVSNFGVKNKLDYINIHQIPPNLSNKKQLGVYEINMKKRIFEMDFKSKQSVDLTFLGPGILKR